MTDESGRQTRGIHGLQQVDARIDAHLVQHVDHVLSRDVAGRAGRVRAAAQPGEHPSQQQEPPRAKRTSHLKLVE